MLEECGGVIACVRGVWWSGCLCERSVVEWLLVLEECGGVVVYAREVWVSGCLC